MTKRIVRQAHVVQKGPSYHTSRNRNSTSVSSSNATDFENLISTVSTNKHSPIPNLNHENGIATSHTFQELTAKADDVPSPSDTLTLLIVEPYFVFTCWDISDASMMAATDAIGQRAKLTLRYYDITHSPDLSSSRYWDLEIFDKVGNCYLKLEKPEQRLYLEIGMKDETGSFIKISGSDVMYMPDEIISKPGPMKWLKVAAATALSSEVNDNLEYMDADHKLLKKILGPYFYDILMRGRFSSIINSTMEAMFHLLSAAEFRKA